MAKGGKTLAARRHDATNDSLLIRSAESLGRVIGSLQRQLDAARQIGRATDTEFKTNGHRPVKQREAATKGAAQRKTKSLRAAAGQATRAASTRAVKRVKPASKKTVARKRSATKRRA